MSSGSILGALGGCTEAITKLLDKEGCREMERGEREERERGRRGEKRGREERGGERENSQSEIAN